MNFTPPKLLDRAVSSGLLSACLLFLLVGTTAHAQEITGTPGAPDATTTIDGHVLPPPPQKFGGEIELNAAQSKPYWPARVVPPKGAPNILLIMTDDVGFAAPSTFGGVIPTPSLDRIANNGLRYTNFHSTALCSPTCVALITGRNHHSVGFGVVSETSTGYPGYNSLIPKDTATIGRILRENGYRTAWFGKDHNTPTYQTSQAGPFDQWPNGMGFRLFLRFHRRRRQPVGAEPLPQHHGDLPLPRAAGEMEPHHRDGRRRHPLDGPDARHRPLDAVVRLLRPRRDARAASADPGMGAEDQRHASLRQGVECAARPNLRQSEEARRHPPGRPADALAGQFAPALGRDDRRGEEALHPSGRRLRRLSAYTDHEIGRVIQTVEDMGELDNTLIIYISGDNGASAEGSPKGTPSEVLQFNGIELPVAEQMKFYDVWPTQYAYSHFAVPWAWAFDTPYKWTKQIPSFFGGTRQGMAISWPGHIKDKGGVRWQFHHVIDVVPTLLEATGIPAPDTVDGISQKPIEGVSMAYSFDKANADAPSPHKIQYFEMLGVQGLYNDGWMLSAVPKRAPWQLLGKAIEDPATAFKFELYDVRHDWTQYTDVSAQNPTKMKEMTDLMFGEFAKYQVLPLDASAATRFVVPRPSLVAGRKVFTYSGDPISGIPNGEAPNLLNTSYTITADIDVPQGGGEGVIITQGGRFGGDGLDPLKGKPVFTWNLLDLKRVKWQGPDVLAPGKHTLAYDFKYDGLGFATLAFNNISGLAHPGTGTSPVDGKVVATQTMERTIPLLLPWDETFDIGSDTGTPVDDTDYQVPFAFTGKIDKLTISVTPPMLTDQDKQKLMEAEHAAQDAN